MTRARLDQIRDKIERRLEQAQRVLNGDTEYDGADGARYIKDLCSDFLEVINDFEPYLGPLPPVAGRESP